MAIEEIPSHLLKQYPAHKFFCLFTSNGHEHGKKLGYDWLLAMGVKSSITGGSKKEMEDFMNRNKQRWLFGHLCFEWNNPYPQHQAEQFQKLYFPVSTIVEPLTVIGGKGKECILLQGEMPLPNETLPENKIDNFIKGCDFPDWDTYNEAFEKIYHHILRGDTYELNLCVHLSGKGVIQPLETFLSLNEISEAPHAVFYKWGDSYCLGSSPERFIKKEGKKITTHPMKGTAARSRDNKTDKANLAHLKENLKERKENIMVADLARNDLSKVASKGSVAVEKLCHTETYRQVHQMESIITCEVEEEINPVAVFDATFPMASMTGMPKKRVLELIAANETAPRNLYSGSIACFAPGGNFDSLVAIRSILYNQKTGDLSCSAGSAITDMSTSREEYEECRVKARAMLRVLGG
ncbi:MAG: chorismate-binding protein [Bacteroidota bacterium]